MAKRKRTWTEETSEALPDSKAHADLSNARDIGVMDVLPGITRKITACGACRKQKVCHRPLGLQLSLCLGGNLINGRSNVICPRVHHVLDAGAEDYLVF